MAIQSQLTILPLYHSTIFNILNIATKAEVLGNKKMGANKEDKNMGGKKIEDRKKTDYKKLGKMDYKGKTGKRQQIRRSFEEDEDEYGEYD
ncbi:MAG: hypothetical protein GKB99_02980 [Methanocellales archaeon]|nr:hypothetical protein [Methanocellales archaeon]